MKFLQEMIAKKKTAQQAPAPVEQEAPEAPEITAKTFEAPDADWGAPSAAAWEAAEAAPAAASPNRSAMNGHDPESHEADADYEDSMADISLDLQEDEPGYEDAEDDGADPVFGVTEALAADDEAEDDDAIADDQPLAGGYDEDFDEDLEPIQPRLGRRHAMVDGSLDDLRRDFTAHHDTAEDEGLEDDDFEEEDAHDAGIAVSEFEEAPEDEAAAFADAQSFDDELEGQSESDEHWGAEARLDEAQSGEFDDDQAEDEASLEDGLEMAGRIAGSLQAEAEEMAATAPAPRVEPEDPGRPDTRVVRVEDPYEEDASHAEPEAEYEASEVAPAAREEPHQPDASMYFEQPPEERLMEKTNEILAGSAAKAGQRKLWDNDGSAAPQGAPAEPAAEMQPKRRAGRVKTRLLGFHRNEATSPDVFAAEAKPRVATSGPAMFPVGWILVVKGPGRGASYPLFAGASKIGRGEDQAIRLDFGDYSISRDNHAAVAYDDESHRFFLGHGGKANLVRLNNTPVLSTETLTDGDEIRIGETTLRFVALCGPEFSWDETGDDDERHAAIR